MGKLVVSLDNVVIKEFQITKERTTLGRRPYNDIVIDNLAVSGEHAVLTAAQSDVYIEDLNSTNGIVIRGKRVRRHALRDGDVISMGQHELLFVDDQSAEREHLATTHDELPRVTSTAANEDAGEESDDDSAREETAGAR